MTRRRTPYEPTPRVLSERSTGRLVGMCESTFREKRPRLEAEGFPKIDPLTGRRDCRAIENWMDVRAGLAQDGRDNGLMAKIEEFRNAS